MIRKVLVILLLVLPTMAGRAAPTSLPAPAEYAEYFRAVRQADAITDPLQRCLAYPDLPGHTWAPGVAKARCKMFLTPPLRSLDEIGRLLTQPDGPRTLEADFTELLQAHYSSPAQREHYRTALLVFADKNRAQAERIARDWLAIAPESAFAHTALGVVLAKRGWDARGGKYIAQTPEPNLQRMNSYFVEAAKAHSAALDANPKILLSCEELMRMGRQSSDELQRLSTQKCLAADPTSYYVVNEMMAAAEPRWGGSGAAMRAVAAYAQAKASDNPVLGLMSFHHVFYEIDRMEDGDTQAIEMLEPLTKLVPNAAFFRLVGGAHLRKNDPWKALIYLSQALRFSPDSALESRFRASALSKVGELEWSRADAERAVELEPNDGLALLQLGHILWDVDGPAAAIPFYERAIADIKTQEDAHKDFCNAIIAAKQFDNAFGCIEELLTSFPNNAEGWRQRLFLMSYDAPGSKEAMEKFIHLSDLQRWPYMTYDLQRARLVYDAMYRPETTVEAFSARAVRAQALQESQAFADYEQRITPLRMELLKSVVKACTMSSDPNDDDKIFVVMDVMADGSIDNVEAAPSNLWSECVDKEVTFPSKLPHPPKLASGLPYPLLILIGLTRPTEH